MDLRGAAEQLGFDLQKVLASAEEAERQARDASAKVKSAEVPEEAAKKAVEASSSLSRCLDVFKEFVGKTVSEVGKGVAIVGQVTAVVGNGLAKVGSAMLNVGETLEKLGEKCKEYGENAGVLGSILKRLAEESSRIRANYLNLIRKLHLLGTGFEKVGGAMASFSLKVLNVSGRIEDVGMISLTAGWAIAQFGANLSSAGLYLNNAGNDLVKA